MAASVAHCQGPECFGVAGKVRFVLEHRLAELAAQLAPRDADIARLTARLEARTGAILT